MNASDTCLTAIKGWEGCAKWNSGVFVVYPDLNGFQTIGWGHKLTHQDQVACTFDEGISQEVADALFLSDIQPVENQVNGLGLVFTQGEFDALVSFTYNLGISNTKTMLSHGLALVPQEIPLWVHAAGVVEPGLVKRRAQEVGWWNS